VEEDVGLGRLRRPRPVHLTDILGKHDHLPTPTDRSASCLISQLRLMPIGRPRGSPLQYTLTWKIGNLVLYGRPWRSPWHYSRLPWHSFTDP